MKFMRNIFTADLLVVAPCAQATIRKTSINLSLNDVALSLPLDLEIFVMNDAWLTHNDDSPMT